MSWVMVMEQEILALLPGEVGEAVKSIPEPIEEIRLRAGRPASVVLAGGERFLAQNGRLIPVDQPSIARVVERAAGYSVYAVQDSLSRGYCILPGGHRLGVCGRRTTDREGRSAMVDFTSVDLRVARQIRGLADPVTDLLWQNPASTLILGAPGSGKTTLLRDLIRQLSDRFHQRVSVVDERGELGAVVDGTPRLDLGRSTDILTGCGKEEGVYLLLRAMNPQWIALDEISCAGDLAAVERASYCGIRFLATVHGWDREDLVRRPLYRRLMDARIFSNLITIDQARELHTERMDLTWRSNGSAQR